MTAEKPEPTYVTVDDDLAALISRRAALAPAVKQAQEELRALNDAIKVELSTRAPESEDTRAGGLRLCWKVSRRLNQRKLKEMIGPETYDSLCVDSGTWVLMEDK